MELSSEAEKNAIYYVSVFVINPIFIGLWLFFLSLKKTIPKKNEKKIQYGYKVKSSLSEVKVHMSKSLGKQMHFRGMDK